MSEKWTVGWRYTPADFFPRPFSQCVDGQWFEVSQGWVKAPVDTLRQEWSESLSDSLQGVVLWLFQRQQVQNYRQFELLHYTVKHVAEDGSTTWSTYKGGVLTMSGDLAACHLASDGSPVQGGPGPGGRQEERVVLASISHDVVADTVLCRMLSSLGRAIDDQANELVHLYEIRDALKTRFEGEAKAYSALGVSSTDWKRLGRLANDYPLRQGRHRGEHAGELRDATPDELEQARSIAKELISAYIKYLETSSSSGAS